MLLDPHHISWWTRKSHWCNLFSRSSLETSNIPGHKTSLRIVLIHYHAFNLELMNILQLQHALQNHTQDLSAVFQLDCMWFCRFGFWSGKKNPGISEDKRHLPLVPKPTLSENHLGSPEIDHQVCVFHHFWIIEVDVFKKTTTHLPHLNQSLRKTMFFLGGLKKRMNPDNVNLTFHQPQGSDVSVRSLVVNLR